MNVEKHMSPRGEFVVLTGRGHVRSARRTGSRSGGVELELAPEGIAEGQLGVDATIEDASVDPFASLFAEGVAAFVLRHRRTLFAFRIEVIRRHGVDKATPIRNIPQKYLFRRVTVLEPAEPFAQEVVA